MSAPPPVTWIMPVKNGMPYLPETLASIEAQTFREVHFLAWDNDSEDGTVEELRKWIPNRLPGEVITGDARPIGESLAGLVERAQSPICARIDADDLADPERLVKQVRFLAENPAVGVVASMVRKIDPEGKVIDTEAHVSEDLTDLLNQMLNGNPLCHPSVTFRREAVLQVGNYRHDPDCYEDLDLWLRMLGSGAKIHVMPEVLASYRRHPTSITAVDHQQKLFIDRLRCTHAKNAEAFLGLPGQFMRDLYDKKLTPTLPHLKRLARAMERIDGVPVGRRLRMPSFRENVNLFIADEDFWTRSYLNLTTGRPRQGLHYLKKAVAQRFLGHGKAAAHR